MLAKYTHYVQVTPNYTKTYTNIPIQPHNLEKLGNLNLKPKTNNDHTPARQKLSKPIRTHNPRARGPPPRNRRSGHTASSPSHSRTHIIHGRHSTTLYS